MEAFRELLQEPLLARYGQLFLLILARLLPVVTFTPVFGSTMVPGQVRIGFSGLVAGLFVAPLGAGLAQVLPPSLFLALLAKEALLGTIVAVALRLVFELLSASGALIDLTRGAGMANLLDPTSRQQTSVLAVAFQLAFVTLFLSAGGHRLLLTVVGEGFRRYPPESLLPPALVGGRPGFGAALPLLGLFREVLIVAVQLAAPVIAVTLVLDVALALLNRAAQRIQVFFLGMTIKATLGVGILLFVFALVAETGLDLLLRATRRLGDFV